MTTVKDPGKKVTLAKTHGALILRFGDRVLWDVSKEKVQPRFGSNWSLYDKASKLVVLEIETIHLQDAHWKVCRRSYG